MELQKTSLLPRAHVGRTADDSPRGSRTDADVTEGRPTGLALNARVRSRLRSQWLYGHGFMAATRVKQAG